MTTIDEFIANIANKSHLSEYLGMPTFRELVYRICSGWTISDIKKWIDSLVENNLAYEDIQEFISYIPKSLITSSIDETLPNSPYLNEVQRLQQLILVMEERIKEGRAEEKSNSRRKQGLSKDIEILSRMYRDLIALKVEKKDIKHEEKSNVTVSSSKTFNLPEGVSLKDLENLLRIL